MYPSAKIWAPNNLSIGAGSTVGPQVNLYNQGTINIEEKVIISQGAYLCASTHDYNDPRHPLVVKDIRILSHAWICAEAFVGPGVIVGEGSVVGARAVLTRDSSEWGVYAGNPAIRVKGRTQFNG